jgi:L-ascorbate metabolism protein UlaG (beta-lactamase superfamily)
MFVKTVYQGLKAMALLHFFPAGASGNGSGADNELHYRPLNGESLRDIAAQKTHHGPNGRFLNPLGELRRNGRLGKVLYWKLFKRNEFKPFLKDQPVNPVRIDWEPVKASKGLSVTFVKHAGVVIKDIDRYLYVDPVLFEIFPFIEDYTPLDIDLGRMPRPDHILITHGHYDHINTASLETFDRGTHVISPLGYDDIFGDLGMRNRSQLDWYDTIQAKRRSFTLLPCNHWTMRNPIVGPNTSLWGSYLIKTASGHTIYHSGDTAWFDGFDQIGNEFDIDLAIINLGAYEPRWFMAPSHMNPAETVAALKLLRARKLIITHWGTFQLGDEPVHFPPLHLKRELEKQGLLDRWVDIRHGETYYLQ